MLRTADNRRKYFSIALIHAEKTAKAFAAEQGVTETHLHMVLSGRRESNRLTKAIDAFIAAHARIAIPA